MKVVICTRDSTKVLKASLSLDQGLDDYHKMLVKFINFETGKSLETIEDFGHIELLNELSGELRKFNVKMNCRKILGFHRLKNISSNSRQKPIPPGIFKGQEYIYILFFSYFIFHTDFAHHLPIFLFLEFHPRHSGYSVFFKPDILGLQLYTLFFRLSFIWLKSLFICLVKKISLIEKRVECDLF